MSTATSDIARVPARWTRSVTTGLVAFLCAMALVLTASAQPAHAYGMRVVSGNIACTAPPNNTIGTSATARGSVAFQLNSVNNTHQLTYVNLGYSSVYAPWSWKFWSSRAGNFYAYGLGSNGNVTSISRWCHNFSA